LVPVDSSDNELRALRSAISLAQQNRPIEIHVDTVHDEPDVNGEIEVQICGQELRDVPILCPFSVIFPLCCK
jgi:hypothetical protein